MLSQSLTFILCLYYYLWEVVFTTKRNYYFFTKPLQATVMLNLYFAETMSLCDYASVP